jgi:hypothetical protein
VLDRPAQQGRRADEGTTTRPRSEPQPPSDDPAVAAAAPQPRRRRPADRSEDHWVAQASAEPRRVGPGWAGSRSEAPSSAERYLWPPSVLGRAWTDPAWGRDAVRAWPPLAVTRRRRRPAARRRRHRLDRPERRSPEARVAAPPRQARSEGKGHGTSAPERLPRHPTESPPTSRRRPMSTPNSGSTAAFQGPTARLTLIQERAGARRTGPRRPPTTRSSPATHRSVVEQAFSRRHGSTSSAYRTWA